MPSKTRLDSLLVARGLADSKTKAQALIMAGLVYSDDRKLTKAGHPVAEDIPLTVKGTEHPWVSRGGMKLDHAIAHFSLDVQGAIALDVGASTGGFTDVLLHHGARKVYAVDVGHGQLAWKLRQDKRVVVLEKTNARHLTQEHIPEPPDFLCCDASFISLRTVLPAGLNLTAENAILAVLIKPQFEAGKAEVNKGKGVILDPAIHEAVCEDILSWFAEHYSEWQPLPGFDSPITQSPITGPEGNKEFLLVLRKV